MFLISQRYNLSKINCFLFRLKLRIYKLKAPAFAYRSLISTPGTGGTGKEKQRRPCISWISSTISTTHMRIQFQHSRELLACMHARSRARALSLSHTHTPTHTHHHSSPNWWRPSYSASILTRDLIWTNRESFHLKIFTYLCSVYFDTIQLTNISRRNSTHMKQCTSSGESQ